MDETTLYYMQNQCHGAQENGPFLTSWNLSPGYVGPVSTHTFIVGCVFASIAVAGRWAPFSLSLAAETLTFSHVRTNCFADRQKNSPPRCVLLFLPECGGVVRKRQGHLVLESYPNNARCEWTVQVDRAFTIDFRFPQRYTLTRPSTAPDHSLISSNI